MTIWLGYPEEIGSSPNSNRDDIESLIEEIEAKDDEVNDLLDQLVGELIEIDKDFKRREKREFIEDAELGSETKKGSNKTSNVSIAVNENSTWPEIISTFETCWDRIENDPRKSELTKKIQIIARYSEHFWQYGAGNSTPLGRVFVAPQTRFEDIYKGKIKTIIDDTAATLLELTTKLNSLEQAVISERSGLESPSNTSAGTSGASEKPPRAVNSNVPQKQIQTLRIDTVSNVVTSNNRWVVEHQVPGRAGAANSLNSSLIQDLGKVPASFMFKGVLTSNSEDRYDLQKKVEILRWFFNQRKPLYFSSRLVNKLEATKVLIEKLNFEEDSSLPYMVEFNCTLMEYNRTNGQSVTSETEMSFKSQIKHWTEFQILNVATKYRKKFIADGAEITSSELSQKIAAAIILENEVLKPIY